MNPWTDGLLHGLKSTHVDHTTRIVTTRCGQELRQRLWDELFGATGWASDVTCPDCLAQVCRCGAALDDGEGWDGLCGECADREAAREFAVNQAVDIAREDR